jgi:hypothetical protein
MVAGANFFPFRKFIDGYQICSYLALDVSEMTMLRFPLGAGVASQTRAGALRKKRRKPRQFIAWKRSASVRATAETCHCQQ